MNQLNPLSGGSICQLKGVVTAPANGFGRIALRDPRCQLSGDCGVGGQAVGTA